MSVMLSEKEFLSFFEMSCICNCGDLELNNHTIRCIKNNIFLPFEGGFVENILLKVSFALHYYF